MPSPLPPRVRKVQEEKAEEMEGTRREDGPVLLLRGGGDGVAVVATEENNGRFCGGGPETCEVLAQPTAHNAHMLSAEWKSPSLAAPSPK
jgi:hypothetical protein